MLVTDRPNLRLRKPLKLHTVPSLLLIRLIRGELSVGLLRNRDALRLLKKT